MSAEGTRPRQARVPNLDKLLLTKLAESVGRHNLLSLEAELDAQGEALGLLRQVARSHYVAPQVAAQRLASIGAAETSAILRSQLPTTKTSRSGDLGEILATEVAEQKLRYEVPVRRLRWKDGRNVALRGDDILGVIRQPGAALQLLKGEAKSRARLDANTVVGAGDVLDREGGRPGRNALVFVATRLREAGRDDVATELEEALLDSFRGSVVEHMLFAAAGNDPTQLLRDHLTLCARKKRTRHAVGVRIRDHERVVAALYAGM